MLQEWILSNWETSKIIYALIISLLCAVIVLKTDRIFKLSDYQGLRYFRNSFFFYGLAFFIGFILARMPILYPDVTKFLFEFFIIIAGFFLLYSFIWKYTEYERESYYSFLNFKAGTFYIIAFLVATADYIINTGIFMNLSQIILFTILSFISYKRFIQEEEKYKFLKYYFIILIYGLFIWILNTISGFLFAGNKYLQIIIYLANLFFFVFILYIIIKIISNKNG